MKKYLFIPQILLIFAASNQISDTKSLPQSSVFCATTSWEKYNTTAPRGVWDNHPEVSANLNLTARSAVSLLSNVKSN